MQKEQLYATTVQYPHLDASRGLHCISVKDFDTFEPVDFRKLFPAENAASELKNAANAATQYALRQRERIIGEAKSMENMGRVASYLGELAVRPFGRLSFVQKLEQPDSLEISSLPITSPGITSNLHRQSFIIGENIDWHAAKVIATSPFLPPLSRELYIEGIAVHELVHLAGIPDIIYFIVEKNQGSNRRNLRVSAVPTTLQTTFNGKDSGCLFEEGFATLCGHMYIWSKSPGVMEDARTEPKQSPQGVKVDLPIRHAYSASPYMFSAWAVERLIDCSPKLWDTLVGSRAYGSSPYQIRKMLKREVDEIDTRLFAVLDNASTDNLDDTMRAASIVDTIVRGHIGR